MQENSGFLTPGTILYTTTGEPIQVNRYIDEGGQGFVYGVIYQGKPHALKWYKPNVFKSNESKFYENLEKNAGIEKSPSKNFLWPKAVTQKMNGSFGYIMDLLPSNYYTIGKYNLNLAHFPSFRVMIDAALQMVNSYRILHNMGLAYMDLNDGNFAINPQNGHVLIMDNDNVTINNKPAAVKGTPRFMAPEIVTGEGIPNKYSDRFSLAVLIYLLFTNNHPLEGKRYLVPGFTNAMGIQLYGSQASFMMDPDNQINGPDPIIHENSIGLWNELPDYMKDIFLAAFSQESIHNPMARPLELQWLQALTRFRSEIVPCSCGEEILIENGKPGFCTSCGKPAAFSLRLNLPGYAIPARSGSRIYMCQLGACMDSEALDCVAQVVQNPKQPSLFGIVNLSQEPWKVITPSGKEKMANPKEMIPLLDGMVLEILGTKISVEKVGR